MCLGYGIVALNLIAVGKGAASKDNTIEKVQLAGEPTPPKKGTADVSHLVTQRSGGPPQFRQLTRFTIILDDATNNLLSNSKVQSYDLVAVQPLSEKVFQVACAHMDCDIISIDMGTRLPFYLKATTINVAVQRGIVFEICYTGCLRDAGARKQLISNARDLMRVTKGKNVIVTSGALKAMEVRGPHDVMNLGFLFGITNEVMQRCMTTNSRHALYHAATRRDTFNGVMMVESVDVLTEADQWKRGAKPTPDEMNADFVAFADDMDEG
ncbi:Ribonuclease P protein subunit p30 [Irineochytrium annulatum]|nr:Ribonuclease P protein subunit p30 [Irineochytrium annulatum]